MLQPGCTIGAAPSGLHNRGCSNNVRPLSFSLLPTHRMCRGGRIRPPRERSERAGQTETLSNQIDEPRLAPITFHNTSCRNVNRHAFSPVIAATKIVTRPMNPDDPNVQLVTKLADEELQHLIQQRADITRRIRTIKQTILGLCTLLGCDELSDDDLRESADHKPSTRRPGLTQSCRAV